MFKFNEIEDLLQIKNLNHPLVQFETLEEINIKGKTYPIHGITIGSKDKTLPTLGLIGGVHGLERIGSQIIISFLQSLLNQLNWSLIPGYNCQPKDSYYDDIFDKHLKNELKDEIQYFYDLKIKISDLEENKGWFNEFSEVNVSDFPVWVHTPEYPKNHEDSYVNVITESMFQDKNNNIHISEKSFKPFFYYQFPLILSTHGHIKKIKELYNLDFFDDIINHSYDNEPNQKLRLDMFVNEIERLSKIKEELINFYKNNKERFESNKQKVLDLLTIVDDDYLFFENLCK